MEIDLKTLLSCLSLFFFSITFGFVFCVHKGWLSA